jgi:glycosyltransferase involved in cell wall biosynthesis
MGNYLKFDYRQFNRENLTRILSRFGTPEKLKILYISTHDPRYTRTESLLALFAQMGLDVRVVLAGRSRFKYVRAIRDLLRYKASCDLVFVAFRGHETLPIVRMFTGKPIVFDAFVSVYDTLCLDRGIFRPNSLAGQFLKAYDRFLCRMSYVVLVDTQAHKEYFQSQFGATNVEYLYVGCNEELFRPLDIEPDAHTFTVFWYGKAYPLQGADVILKAAKLLEGEPVRFRLVGPLRRRYGELLTKLSLQNADLVDFVPYEQLPAEINKADLCLGGHFSGRDKAKRVIAGKTFQFLACGKPTIVGDNPASRELFTEGDLVHFVEMNNPQSLTEKIMQLGRKQRDASHAETCRNDHACEFTLPE